MNNTIKEFFKKSFGINIINLCSKITFALLNNSFLYLYIFIILIIINY